MALVVEDGTIVSGANSYVTTAEYEAWLAARNITSAGTGDSDALEAYILRAMDYFEALDFKGLKQTEDQPLQFPRYQLWIDGYEQSNKIPNEVKTSIFELAYAEERTYGLLDPIERTTKRERIEGALEVEYMDNASSKTTVPSIARALRKLVYPANRVIRA